MLSVIKSLVKRVEKFHNNILRQYSAHTESFGDCPERWLADDRSDTSPGKKSEEVVDKGQPVTCGVEAENIILVRRVCTFSTKCNHLQQRQVRRNVLQPEGERQFNASHRLGRKALATPLVTRSNYRGDAPTTFCARSRGRKMRWKAIFPGHRVGLPVGYSHRAAWRTCRQGRGHTGTSDHVVRRERTRPSAQILN